MSWSIMSEVCFLQGQGQTMQGKLVCIILDGGGGVVALGCKNGTLVTNPTFNISLILCLIIITF